MPKQLKLKSTILTPAHSREDSTEFAWAIATLYPAQGFWSAEDYLALPTNHLVELSDGIVEVLPMPTPLHQMVVAYFYEALKAFISARRLGKVLPAPVPVQLWRGKFREPDVVFVRASGKELRTRKHLDGPELVVEVVSPDDPERDWDRKHKEYAKAGIREYWIADPQAEVIAVYTLQRRAYRLHGRFRKGQRATSRLLAGFSVDVDAALAGED
jgi:Uma2 family endonuclease